MLLSTKRLGRVGILIRPRRIPGTLSLYISRITDEDDEVDINLLGSALDRWTGNLDYPYTMLSHQGICKAGHQEICKARDQSLHQAGSCVQQRGWTASITNSVLDTIRRRALDPQAGSSVTSNTWYVAL